MEGRQVSKKEFDAWCKSGEIRDAKISTFGDKAGEPYNPNRAAMGILSAGEKVWAWVRGPKADEQVAPYKP